MGSKVTGEERRRGGDKTSPLAAYRQKKKERWRSSLHTGRKRGHIQPTGRGGEEKEKTAYARELELKETGDDVPCILSGKKMRKVSQVSESLPEEKLRLVRGSGGKM